MAYKKLYMNMKKKKKRDTEPKSKCNSEELGNNRKFDISSFNANIFKMLEEKRLKDQDVQLIAQRAGKSVKQLGEQETINIIKNLLKEKDVNADIIRQTLSDKIQQALKENVTTGLYS